MVEAMQDRRGWQAAGGGKAGVALAFFYLDTAAGSGLSFGPYLMNGTMIALTSAGCIFGGTLLGLALRKVLPADHLGAESKDAVTVGAGMISMMSALVLGLLVTSAKNTYDSVNTAITEGGARIILIDRLLAAYGPETKDLRTEARRGVAATIEILWPEEAAQPASLLVYERGTAMEKLLKSIRELKPQTDAQRVLQSRLLTLGDELLLSRWQQIEQAQLTLPPAFLVILLFWLTMLYTTFGLFAPHNGTVVTAMFIGALALATAIFLIVEMSHPMAGYMKVSSAPLRKALEHLGR